VGTQCASLEYLYRDAPEVGWAGGGGEMVDLLEFSGKVYVDSYVVVYIRKIRVADQEGATFSRTPVERLSMQTTL
jgi:hypothetical protein